MAGRRKLIIDSDAGVDDANAILMALGSPDVDVIAITTVSGNTTAPQSGRNVLRVLQLMNRLDIPVYVGCSEPLLGDVKPRSDYHGSDGFGDAPDPNAPDDSHLQTEHAVQALLRLTKEHAGEISLVCLGPLINIAMAIRMDPEFGKRLKDCHIMGGTYQGKGNMTASAEFNFYFDPESAYVVLNQLKCPITLVPWEVCDRHSLSWEWYKDFTNLGTPMSNFIAKIEKNIIEKFYLPKIKEDSTKYYELVDQCALATATIDGIILNFANVYASVETGGKLTCGQMIVDWNNHLKKSPNVQLVLKMDLEKMSSQILKIFAC